MIYGLSATVIKTNLQIMLPYDLGMGRRAVGQDWAWDLGEEPAGLPVTIGNSRLLIYKVSHSR